MLKAEDQTEWPSMYVYQNDLCEDLCNIMFEFLGECEHEGFKAACKEVSSDVIEDVEAWKKSRKKLLVADFAEYLKAQS